MFPINDALDAILLGTFLFGILFTLGALLLGAVDLGGDGHGGGDHGYLSEMFNLTAILAFVTWFGGVGYLARNGLEWHWLAAIPLGIVGGALAAYIVVWMLRKLSTGDTTLNPRAFERVGVLARVTSSIRPGGVGEIVWEQNGSRMVTSARGASAEPIARGTEVLILRVERGVAVVEPFEGLLNGEDAATGTD